MWWKKLVAGAPTWSPKTLMLVGKFKPLVTTSCMSLVHMLVLMPERLYEAILPAFTLGTSGAEETILKYSRRSGVGKTVVYSQWHAEYFVTATWAILLVVLVALALYRKITLSIGIQNMELFKANISIMFWISFFLQCLLSLYIDSRYEKGLIQYGISAFGIPMFIGYSIP